MRVNATLRSDRECTSQKTRYFGPIEGLKANRRYSRLGWIERIWMSAGERGGKADGAVLWTAGREKLLVLPRSFAHNAAPQGILHQTTSKLHLEYFQTCKGVLSTQLQRRRTTIRMHFQMPLIQTGPTQGVLNALRFVRRYFPSCAERFFDWWKCTFREREIVETL